MMTHTPHNNAEAFYWFMQGALIPPVPARPAPQQHHQAVIQAQEALPQPAAVHASDIDDDEWEHCVLEDKVIVADVEFLTMHFTV